MLRRIIPAFPALPALSTLSAFSLLLLTISLSLSIPLPAHASSSTPNSQQQALADFPTVDPNYIYDQLFYMATNFPHREAGYDQNLPANINGHDEFAAYWSQEIVRDLHGFGPQVRIDKFAVQGWQARPAVVPAFNVEVTVPGVTHPEQVVVLGCHYDGMAISTQSANDDASGCAIELGVAMAMGQYWRIHHVYPARTLRFVIFDAEEQGLFGSFHYLNATINGDVNNVVAMFNEEQSGIAYPLRYLGNTSNPLLPFYAFTSPLKNNDLYPHQDRLSQQQQNNITHFRALLQQAILPVFQQFQALGFQSLIYHDSNARDISQPVFTPDQVTNIQLLDDNLGSSDQMPFTLAGLPCATFVGNSTYYDNNPPPWSYPYDQRQDTIQLMNTFANGSSQRAQALTLSLALPGMLTTWMLHSPDILGQVSAGANPIAAISDVGQALVNQNLSLDARASFDPNSNGTSLHYAWNFGDGSTASGISVNHTYTTAGAYTLSLSVTSTRGTTHISQTINVGPQSTSITNPYLGPPSSGAPQSNPAVKLPIPGNNQPDQQSAAPPSTSSSSSGTLIIAIIAVIIILSIVAIEVNMRRRKKTV